MSTKSFNKLKGLATFFNHISSNPEGAMTVANNVVIDRDNILEPRRGMKVITDIPSQAKQLLNYKDRVLAHYDNHIGYLDNRDPGTLTTFKGVSNIELSSPSNILTLVDHNLDLGDSVTFAKARDYSVTNAVAYLPYPSGINEYTDYVVYNIINKDQFQIALSSSNTAIVVGAGTTAMSYDYVLNEVVSKLRVKSIELNSNLYVTARDGVKKISKLSPYFISKAGGITALNCSLALNFSSATGFLGPQDPAPLDVEVAYRVVWGTKDVNGTLILGKPSERAVIINTTRLNATVDISFPVPEGITTDYFYQIYRTNVFGINGSGDEMRLVLEAAYDGFSSVIAVNDATPESIRDSGTPLYTNEFSGDGVLQANERPPVCQDITVYKNRAWFANTKTSQKLDLTFLGFDGVAPRLTVNSVVGSPTSTTLDVGTHTIAVGDWVAVVTPDDIVLGDGQFQVTAVTATTITFASDSSYYSTATHVYTSNIQVVKNTQANRYFLVGQPEITDIVHAAFPLSNINSGDYFNLTSMEDKIKYYFWFAKASTDVDPLPYGVNRVGIKIDLYTAVPISTDEISDIIVNTINSTTDFNAFKTAPGAITVPTATSGMVTDPISGTFVGSSITSMTKVQEGYGENVSLGFVRLSSYISPAAAIEDTAKSLVNVINFTENSPVYAYYLNTNISLPGQFYLEEKSFSETSFQVYANNNAFGAAFSPQLSPTIAANSTNNVGNNVLMFSKEQQPESVPTVNSFRIGPQDKAIKRILALRDSLFIFKEEGIYRLTGENEANFNVALFDNSATISAPDSAVVLNNQIHCLTTQGVSTVSETGVGIISRIIENIFNQVTTEDFVNSESAIFGVSYEADRSYLIFIPNVVDDITAQIAYRYNSFTQTWTTFEKSAVCGVVSSKNKMYLGADDIDSIEVERKKLTSRDYVDREYARTVSAYQSSRMYVDNALGMEIGDVLTQKQYITIGQLNNTIDRLKLDPQLGFSQSFDKVITTGGADLSDTFRDLVIELNLKDILRNSKTINLATDVNTTTDTFTIPNHDFVTGNIIQINTPGTLPTPLVNAGYYRIFNATTNTFQLSRLDTSVLVQNSALGLGTFTSGAVSLLFNLVRDIDYATSTIKFVDHGLSEGDLLTFTSTDTLPSGLVSGRKYFASNVNPNDFQLKEAVIDLGGSPTGTATVTRAYYYSGTSDSRTLQQEFNDIIKTLNDSESVFFANYTESEGSEDLDLYIKAVNYSQNYVTLEFNAAFYIGAMTHYKSIRSEMVWDHTDFGDPSIMKHVRSSTVMTENNSLNKVDVGFSSDLSGDFENVTFTLDGSGVFGKSKFGHTAFGGNGTQYPIRTLVPRQKQRCRMMAIRVFHYSAFFKFNILGVSFDYEVNSERTVRK